MRNRSKMQSTLNTIDAVDSFGVLLRGLEQEIIHLCSDVRDCLAVVGFCYATRKTFSFIRAIFEAVHVHWFGQYTKIDWKEQFGPWAVVTGSSEGIGRAYAEELAKRGINIVLISWDEPGLRSAKSEIESLYQVAVEYIYVDFACENQREMYDYIMKELESKEIGLLVNNVGTMYDYPDVLLNVPTHKLWQLIYVNIGAATMMTHMLLPQMVSRGRGGVVAMTSGTSTQITPQMTVYSATKRYLDYFIHGIAYEYRNSGVVFQCLAPFYVTTRMNSYSNTLSSCGFFIPSAQRYACHAVSTLGQALHTTGYYPHTLLLWISRSLPLSVWMWGSDKFNCSLRQQAFKRNMRPRKSMSKERVSEINRKSVILTDSDS